MNKRTDISQEIKKYLNGELDARAMHNLERRAQDDPFLMDALEGYEKSRKEQNARLNELTRRLQQRTEAKERRIIPYRILAIAASILLFLGIGLFWYLNHTPRQVEVKNMVAVSLPKVKTPAVPAKPSKPAAATNTATNRSPKQYAPASNNIAANVKRQTRKKPVAASEMASNPPVVDELKTAVADNADNAVYKSKDTTPLNEMAVMEYSSQQKTNIPLKPAGTVVDSLLKLPGTTITGLVKDNNGPIPGATVRIKGTDIATLTNGQGRFTLTNAPDRSVLDLGYIGYQPKQVYVYKPDSMVIAMQPSANSLNEVVVTGFGARRKTNAGGGPTLKEAYLGKPVKGMIKDAGEPVPGATVKIKGTNKTTLTDANGRFTLYGITGNTVLDVTADGYQLKEAKVIKPDMQIISIQPAAGSVTAQVNENNQELPPRPSGGWGDFSDYLKQNAVSPDGRAGTVKLSFMVNADNTLSDFKIIKGVSPQTNNAAIKLVWIGPTWFSRSDDQPETVTVTIKFKNSHQQ